MTLIEEEIEDSKRFALDSERIDDEGKRIVLLTRENVAKVEVMISID